MSEERYQLLVIGGGPAAWSAVSAFRAAGGDGPVALVAGERRLPYTRPAITKELLRGEVSERDIELTDADELARSGIPFIAGYAAALHPAEHAVTLSGGRRLEYASCLLATGAEPTRLPVPGADDPGVRTLRSIEDLHELRAWSEPRHDVVVIGAGFIGCEIAASLREMGHRVAICDRSPAPNAARIGDRAAAVIGGWLEQTGVRLLLGEEVNAIARRSGGLRVCTASRTADAHVTVMAAGISPRAELATAAGLALEHGAIPADARMRSGLPDVLVAGDVSRAANLAAGRRLRVEHWGDALAQGEIAGRTAAGADAQWNGVPGFWTTIAGHTLKHAGWGDGYDEVRWEPHAGEAFTAWYRGGDRIVGVLTHERDDDYERGRELIGERAAWS